MLYMKAALVMLAKPRLIPNLRVHLDEVFF